MTDTNSTPTPPGDFASGGHTPASQQPVPLQPTQPAPYSAQGTQPYGGQQAYTGHAGQATGYGTQQPYGYGAQQAPGSAQHSAGQVYGQQTYEAEPVSMHAQHAALKGNGGKTFLIAFAGALVACGTRLRRVGHYECDDSGQFWLGYFNGRHRPLHRRDDGHRAQRGSDAGRGRVREVLALCGRHHGVRRGFPE